MKLLLLLSMVFSMALFAETEKAPEKSQGETKKFRSMDGSYEIEVSKKATHRCTKDAFHMDHTIYDNGDKACALVYKKMEQEEKVIATSRSSAQFCMDKANQMMEKFKSQGFTCQAL